VGEWVSVWVGGSQTLCVLALLCAWVVELVAGAALLVCRGGRRYVRNDLVF
jgi:hypothetical protein